MRNLYIFLSIAAMFVATPSRSAEDAIDGQVHKEAMALYELATEKSVLLQEIYNSDLPPDQISRLIKTDVRAPVSAETWRYRKLLEQSMDESRANPYFEYDDCLFAAEKLYEMAGKWMGLFSGEVGTHREEIKKSVRVFKDDYYYCEKSLGLEPTEFD